MHMKILLSIILVLFFGNDQWLADFTSAKTEAKNEKKHIIVNFSGSDWCGPCIRMHKEIFDTEDFTAYAKENLVLVRADFPRLKKNQLPAEQLKKNNDLAIKYNPDGDFPLTVLLDADGKVIKEWKGYQNVSPKDFVEQINDAIK